MLGIDYRQLGWLLAGFGCATAVCAVLEAVPARAQGFNTTVTTIQPARRTRPAAPSPRTTVSPGAAVEEALAAPAIPAAGQRDRSGSETAEPTAEGEDEETTGRPRVGQRPAPRDGDLEPAEPEEVRDGIADIGEPEAPEDGIDPTRIDTRTPEDAAVFESPPAGHDRSLFALEIEPILDRRPAQLFNFEPYDPVGIKVGSMIVLPEIDIGINWLSNVFRSTNARPDMVYDVRPTARVLSNWRRHALEFRASGLASGFSEFSSENERAYVLEARGRLDIGRRSNIEAFLGHDVTQEARSAIGADRAATNRADITTDRAALALNHRFNRLSVQLRGSLTETKYGATSFSDGTREANNDRNFRLSEEAVRLSWEWKPTLFTFLEYALNQRDYQMPLTSDGIRRDSSGDRLRAGIGFGNASRKIRGEISVGFGRQKPEDSRLKEVEGIVIDANAAYRLSALTTMLITARSDVAESTVDGSGGAMLRQGGIELRHALHRYLIANAGVSYSVQSYSGVRLDERQLDTTLGFEYFLNREAVLYGGYQHTWFDSTDVSRNYNADVVRVGMRLRK